MDFGPKRSFPVFRPGLFKGFWFQVACCNGHMRVERKRFGRLRNDPGFDERFFQGDLKGKKGFVMRYSQENDPGSKAIESIQRRGK